MIPPYLATLLFLSVLSGNVLGQSGRRPGPSEGDRAALLNLVAERDDGSAAAIGAKDVALYDDGIEQRIDSLSRDPGPARIVLLFDNSLSVRMSVKQMAEVAHEFAYEIYEGDQIMIAAYDEQPAIIQDWTDDPRKVGSSLPKLRKKGDPHLFDALQAVTDQALQPITGVGRKRVVVVIGDGLDRGSKTHFTDLLLSLQKHDIAVYVLELPDRTGGAHRRDQPKAAEVVRKLTEGTGGRALTPKDPRADARAICDELKKNRYVLAYTPTNIIYGQPRRLLLVADPGITLHYKEQEPPR